MADLRRRKVLILGNDTRSFLAVIRSLGRRGIEVHVAWCDPDCPARYSRYVTKFHAIPKFSLDSMGWKTTLEAILRQENFDLIIPCGDPSIIPLQRHRQDFQAFSPLYLLDDRTFGITYNKRETTILARRLGIPVPEEIEVTSSEELHEALQKIPLPIVLKPLTSFTLDNLDQHHDVRKAYSREKAQQIAEEMLAKGPVLLQENFIGQGTGVELIAESGEILSVFQHLRLHEPPEGGAGTYRKSVTLHPDLYNAAARFIDALNYTGVAMFEFKLDPKTGRWVFLEINARFWGSLPLAVAAGIDFPWYLYQLLVDRKRQFNRTYREELYCRDWTGDIDWFRSNLRADHANPYLHTVPLKKVFGELVNILALRERSDTFTMDDPYPAVVDLGLWMGRKSQGLLRRADLHVRSYSTVKNYFRRKAVGALGRDKTILYLCTGNICRSPFAAYATQSIFPPEITVISAGILPQQGRQCPANAVVTAREFDVDLSEHTASQVTEQNLHEAGIIFVFDTVAYEYLLEKYSWVRDKIFYLGSFLESRPIIIDDPFGGDLRMFRDTYRDIMIALGCLKDMLRQELVQKDERSVSC